MLDSVKQCRTIVIVFVTEGGLAFSVTLESTLRDFPKILFTEVNVSYLDSSSKIGQFGLSSP